MKGACLWAAVCQSYNRVALALPLNSPGVDTQCRQPTHTCIQEWCVCSHTQAYVDTRVASLTQNERYWRDLQPNGTKFPQCSFMGLWISSLNGPSASQPLRHPYARIWMGHLRHKYTQRHPNENLPVIILLILHSLWSTVAVFITHSHMEEAQGHLFVDWMRMPV